MRKVINALKLAIERLEINNIEDSENEFIAEIKNTLLFYKKVHEQKHDKIGNPYIDNDGIKSGYYKGNTIYDKGEKSGYEYRFYMRSKPNRGFNKGPITANGKTLNELFYYFNKNIK